MMINPNNIMNLYQMLRQDPARVLTQRFNIPQNINLNDPNIIIQHLLNSGQVSQSQVNQLMGMRNDPWIKNVFGIH